MSTVRLLTVLLMLSLLINLLLFYRINQPGNAQQSVTQTMPPAPFSRQHDNNDEHLTLANNRPEQQILDEAAVQQLGQTIPDETAVNRHKLLQDARLLLQEEHYSQLQSLLRQYLQQHPLDTDFLLLEAKLYVKTELLSDAIAYYYSLNRLPMTALQHQEIEDSISELSSQTISQLQRAYSWDTLAIFVEPLLQLEPQNREYILALAEAYAQQSQFNLMENVLASIDYFDPAAQRIRQLSVISQADMPTTDESPASTDSLVPKLTTTAVPLIQLGDQYIVNAQLGGQPVALLIDTGASITALTRKQFKALPIRNKVNFVGRFSVNTAAGKVLAPMYQFSELKLNHAIVENISIVVLPVDDMEYADGLLGMNFLREFDFKIDQRQLRLLLTR